MRNWQSLKKHITRLIQTFWHCRTTSMASPKVYFSETTYSQTKKENSQELNSSMARLDDIFALSFNIPSLLLFWRLLTLITIQNNRELIDEVISITIPEKKKRKVFMKNKHDINVKILCYCFKQLLMDLPYFLLFMIMHCISPWRAKNVWNYFYKPYNQATSLHNQIIEHRASVLSNFKKGFEDIWLAINVIVILLTLVKLPFLVLLILKNESKARFTVKKCCDIAFRELLTDMLYSHYFVLVCVLLILAPWRIFTLFFMIVNQVSRTVHCDNQKRGPTIPSMRGELAALFKTVIYVDLLQPFKIVIIAFTIHRIPRLFATLSRGIKALYRPNKEADVFVKNIDIQFKKSIRDFSRALCGMLIGIFIVRIKATLKRLRANREYILRFKRLAANSQKSSERSDAERLSLDNITWDLFGRICQFLSVPDLGKLNQVNRKLYHLLNKDFYWEYQFRRDWRDYQANTRKLSNFRQKSIYAYRMACRSMVKPALTEEERDRLGGPVYIMFDEAVNSLKAVPWILMIPANILSLLLLKIFKPVHGNEHYLHLRSNYLVDNTRLKMIPALKQDFLKVIVPTWENFNSLHLDLERWYRVAETKYAAELGYLLSYIGYLIIKNTSAGGYNPMRVEIIQETGLVIVTRGELQVHEIQSNVLKFLFYWVQLALSFIYILGIVTYQITPIVAILHFFGPIASPTSTLIVAYITSYIQSSVVINTLGTQALIIEHSTPFFKPWEAIRITYIYLRDMYLIISWHLFRKYFWQRAEHNHIND